MNTSGLWGSNEGSIKVNKYRSKKSRSTEDAHIHETLDPFLKDISSNKQLILFIYFIQLNPN